MTLGELVERLGGKLLQGSPQLEIENVSSCEQAGHESLVFAGTTAAAAEALSSGAGAIVLAPGMAASSSEGVCAVEAEQPRLWFARAAKLLSPAPAATGVHSSAVVAEGVQLGENVTVGAGAVVEEQVDRKSVV